MGGGRVTSQAAKIIEPRRVFIPLRQGEIESFRKRKKLPGPEWAEQSIVIPVGSRQGRYQHKNNPALYGVLEIGSRATIRKLVMGKGIQTGGTMAVYILVLREADYSSGGDNALIVLADEGTVRKLSKGRLRKLIDKSPALAALKSANPDDTGIKSIALSNGFTIEAAWISSEASVSSESYRVVVLDEISKEPYRKHRGNIKDAKGRTTVYPDTCKVFILSSPDEDSDDPAKRDPIMVEIESCDVHFDYHVICPDCGKEQVMIFDRFGWPEQKSLIPGQPATVDPAAIRRNKSAWYSCAHCPSHWNDYKRDKAVLAAMKTGWKPSMELEHYNSAYVHFPSWLSPFVSISEVVALWLEAQGDDEKLKKWHNLIAGVSYRRQQVQPIKEEHILKFRSELPRNLVPPDTARLALIVDTQQASFYYKVYAYGYAPLIKPQQIRHGIVETFEDLEGILAMTFKDHDGREFRIASGVIDSGGTRKGYQKHSRTVEVYEWCSRNRIMIPLKGVHGRTGDLLSYKDIMTFPGTNKRIPGGLKRVNVRVDMFKDDLERRLNCEPDDAQAMSYNADIDEAFARHYTGETKDAHGDWQHSKKSQRIDYYDCDVYALAHREMIKLRIPKKPAQRTPEQQQLTQAQQRPQPQSSTRSLPGWFRNRG